MCLDAFLFSYSPQNSTLIIHLTPLLSRGEITFFLSIKAKIKRMKKEPAPVGIASMWNLIMWNRCSSGLVSVVPVKNPITGWHRNNQSTSSLSRSAFSFPLTPSHYFRPYSLIHLSELFQVAASYLSLTPLPGLILVDILITGFISNPPLYLPLFFCHLGYSCPAPLRLHFVITFNNFIISSFSPPLPCFLLMFLLTSRHQGTNMNPFLWEISMIAAVIPCVLYFDLDHQSQKQWKVFTNHSFMNTFFM